MNHRVLVSALALVSAAAISPAVANAGDCFILVHGHMEPNAAADPAEAVGYWNRDGYGDFARRVTNNYESHYAIVNWDAGDDSANAFWEPEAASAVAWQILSIQDGSGDGFDHPAQCEATDEFWVIAHSQGAQVLTYMNGNAYPEAPFFDKAIATDDPNDIGVAPTVDAPFHAALANVAAIFTIGGAINGTQGMDIYCSAFGGTAFEDRFRSCIPSLQTYAAYNPRTYTGANLLKPMYALGGWAWLDGFGFVTSGLLNGEDDGIVNLASQMNCAGSAKRSVRASLAANYSGFVCDRDNKRHVTNSYNMATVEVNHDEERGATEDRLRHGTIDGDVVGCASNKDMAGTIADCMSLLN